MIYADYNGSAPLNSDIRKFLIERLQEEENFANPNASHKIGNRLNRRIEKARKKISKLCGCKPEQIIFNSGASEGISHIFASILEGYICLPLEERPCIITSDIEHAAVLKAGEYWDSKGFNLHRVGSNEDGTIKLDHMESLLKKHPGKIALISVMAANNETGVIQPYKEIAELAHKYDIPFFSDTTQYIGKTPFDFEESQMDFAVSSSHKIGGVIGSGFIIAKDPSLLKPFIHGGGQEFGARAGTQNYIGIECMGEAANILIDHMEELKTLAKYREQFEKNLKSLDIETYIVGENAERLPGTTLVSFPGHSSKTLQAKLEESDIFVTTSSACSDSKSRISHVIQSMGLPTEVGLAVIRISLCHENAENNFKTIFEQIKSLLKSK